MAARKFKELSVEEQRDFRLLVITDLHHMPGATGPDERVPERRGDLAAELLRRAIEDANHRGGFDAIALLGDMLNDGTTEDARAGLEQLRDIVMTATTPRGKKPGEVPPVPLLVVPGNHDGNFDLVCEVFQTRPGLHRIGPYRFIVFADRYAPGDFCTRSESDRQLLQQAAAALDASPIIVLQHNPMSPNIDYAGYPYMLTNRAEVMADYERSGALLSLSGHAHWGQELNFVKGVGYFTGPALCEAPYRYGILSLRGRQVRAEMHSLKLPAAPPVVDVHVHTEFAFCGRDIAGQKMVARARDLGLACVVLTEHAPQLYVQAEDFWTGRHVRVPGLWRNRTHWRVVAYRAVMDGLRDRSYVRIGLEVELDAAGKLILRQEEYDWADVLVGAVHFTSQDPASLSDGQVAAEFMATTEKLLQAGVDVLAHPLRLFGWVKRATPPELFTPLADMLARYGVAAEINFHLNWPEEEFFRQCIARGVKIAFGSDSHQIHEVGNLGANLAMVQKLAGREDVSDLLYYPE